MKKLVLITGVIVSVFLLCSAFDMLDTEVKPTKTLQEKYHASIPGWNVGLEEVYQKSLKTGKPIMANFTGSDWCGWCIRLKASVFSQDEFKKWADENVVLYEVDFPKRFTLPNDIRQENASLQQSLQVRGYPTVWIMNIDKKDGKYNINPLGSLSYEKSASNFIAKANAIIKK